MASKVSNYKRALIKLEKTRCEKCDGEGEWVAAEFPGVVDGYYKKVVCERCDGRGFKPTKAQLRRKKDTARFALIEDEENF